MKTTKQFKTAAEGAGGDQLQRIIIDILLDIRDSLSSTEPDVINNVITQMNEAEEEEAPVAEATGVINEKPKKRKNRKGGK